MRGLEPAIEMPPSFEQMAVPNPALKRYAPVFKSARPLAR